MHVPLGGGTDGVTPERNELLDHLSDHLGLGHGCRDPTMLDDAGGKVREHRVAMLAIAAELGIAL